MKRLLSLLMGIPLLLSALPAAAANDALSPAVTRVLDRADYTLDHVNDGAVSLSFLSYFLGDWSRDVLTPFMRALDVQTQTIDQSQDLLHQTACLRTDVFLLEQKMKKTQEALNKALTDTNVTSIIRLTKLYDFLAERRTFLLAGGSDPTIDDADALAAGLFDPPAAPPQRDAEKPFCYYHSDYLPPSLEGYGCDSETMEKAVSLLPDGTLKDAITKEKETLWQVQGAVEEHLKGAQTLSDLQSSIESLSEGDTPAPPPDARPARTHQTESGCLITSTSTTPRANPSVVVRTLRGPFSLDPDEVRLTTDFTRLRQLQDLQRAASPELSPSAGSSGNDILRFFQIAELERQQGSNREQGRQESETFLIGRDSVQMVTDALQPLRSSVGMLSTLGGATGGLRGFVRDFAYYLRRNCLERPCNERLDRILKIVFQDECFPYTSGAYLSDSPDDPRWKKCADAAGVDPTK